MITIGSRAADAPERSTNIAVNNNKRGVDLPVIVASVVRLCAETETRENWKDRNFAG